VIFLSPQNNAMVKMKMRKALRETQTLRAGCSKAKPKIFTLPQTLFPGVRDGQNLINWRWSYFTYKTQFGEDRCTQFRVIVVTDPSTHTHTHKHTNPQTGPITIHCAAKLSAQCNYRTRRADSDALKEPLKPNCIQCV